MPVCQQRHEHFVDDFALSHNALSHLHAHRLHDVGCSFEKFDVSIDGGSLVGCRHSSFLCGVP